MGRDPLSRRPRTAVTSQLELVLRDAWASGRRVQITTKPPERARVRGTVKQVAATGAFAVIGRTHVPIHRIARIRDAAPLPAAAEPPTTPDGAIPPPAGQRRLPAGPRSPAADGQAALVRRRA